MATNSPTMRALAAVVMAVAFACTMPALLTLAQPAPGELAFNVDLFLWEVVVTGPPREALKVELYAPDGTFLASGSGTLSARGMAAVELRSPAGDRMIPRPGDRLVGATASAGAILDIPPLTVGADLAQGDVFGNTTPYMSLTLTYDGYRWPGATGGGPPVDTWHREADKSGRFSFGLASVMKMRNFDRFRIFLHVGPHTVARYVLTIALSVNQDRRRLVGRLEPFVDYSADVRRGTTVVATGTARTPYEGAIALPLVDFSGNPLAVLTGDLVSVQAAAGLGTRETSILMPDLALELDNNAAAANGHAPAAGDVLLQWQPSALGPEVPAAASVQLAPTRDVDGSFHVTWPGLTAFAPGSRVHMIYVFPDGNFVNFTRALSLVKVEEGGSYACGIGNAFDAVDLQLADASGRAVVGARGRVGEVAGQPAVNPYTSFVTRFSAPGGAPVAAESRQMLTARIGQSEIKVGIGSLDVQPDWAGDRVAARYVPAAGGEPSQMALFDITGACLLEGPPAGPTTGSIPPSDPLLKAGGWYTSTLRGYSPGQGFTVVATDPLGFKVSRQVRRAQAQIYVGTDRVEGLASPHASVTLTLQPASGGTASAVVRAQMDSGAYATQLNSPSGKVVIQPGDIVRLQSAEETQAVTVEPLDAYFSIDFGVFGHAPANRPLRVSLFTELGETVFTTTTDGEGGYSLLPWDLAARLRRDMEDVTMMRVVLPTLNGHEIVVEQLLNPTRVFIPLAMPGLR